MPKTTKTETKKEVKPKAKVEPNALTVSMYSIDGKEAGNMDLPKDLFGAKVNKPLLAQALRVYMNNLKGHFSNTKTRGEVAGSTRKIRAQKGTGGARHGSKKAPIFVHGGIALGPKFRKTILELPKKMKKAALVSALSSKALDGQILGLDGADKLTGKTAQLKTLVTNLGKKDILLVTDGKNDKIVRAASNLSQVEIVSADQINVLNIIKYQSLVLTKEAVEKLEARIRASKKESK